MSGGEGTGGSHVHGDVARRHGRPGGGGLTDAAVRNADAVRGPIGHDGFDCEQIDSLSKMAIDTRNAAGNAVENRDTAIVA